MTVAKPVSHADRETRLSSVLSQSQARISVSENLLHNDLLHMYEQLFAVRFQIYCVAGFIQFFRCFCFVFLRPYRERSKIKETVTFTDLVFTVQRCYEIILFVFGNICIIVNMQSLAKELLVFDKNQFVFTSVLICTAYHCSFMQNKFFLR